MAIRRRGNKFVIDYYPHGRRGKRERMTLPETVQSEDQAGAIEDALKKAARNPDDISLPSPTSIAELIPQYLAWYRIHRSPGTIKDITSAMKHFKRIVGEVRLSDLNSNHINLYKQIRQAEPARPTKPKNKKIKEVSPGSPPADIKTVSNRTINKELSYFSGMLRWCRDELKIQHREFKIYGLPYKRPIPIVLTLDECMRIFAAAEPFFRSFFYCLFILGLRFQEARFIRGTDIDLENRSIKVRQKGGSDKVLPLGDLILKELKSIMPKDPGQYVFLSRVLNRKGERAPIVNVKKALLRASRKAEIVKKVNPHLFRHSIATHLLGQGVDLRIIQKYLGHSSISTTEFYTHVNLEHLRKAGRVIDLDIEKLVSDHKKGNKISRLKKK